MTIAAGFRVRDGVLLCADTEHSGIGINFHKPKIYKLPSNGEFSAVFAIAGLAHLAIATVQSCIARLTALDPSVKRGRAEIKNEVAAILRREFRRHVSAEPNASRDSVYSILFAIWSRLDGHGIYSTWQGSVQEHDGYECIGANWFGHYVIEPMFDPQMGIEEAKTVGAYLVSQATKCVDDCGGATQMVAIDAEGNVNDIDWGAIGEIEESLDAYHGRTRGLLFSMFADADEDFAESLAEFSRSLMVSRCTLGKTNISHVNTLSEQVIQFMKDSPPCNPSKRRRGRRA